jgi:hypothetical protein
MKANAKAPADDRILKIRDALKKSTGILLILKTELSNQKQYAKKYETRIDKVEKPIETAA